MAGALITAGLAAVGQLTNATVTRFGWMAVTAAVCAVAVAGWLAVSAMFGGPSELDKALDRARRAEHAAQTERAGAELLDAALRKVRNAEAEAGAARLEAATAELMAEPVDAAVSAALHGSAGDRVCLDPATVELLNR